MRKLIYFLFLIPLCSSAQPKGFALVKDTVAFKSKLESVAKQTTSIECDFAQEKNITALEEKVVSKGKMFFKKESMLRWEYSSPTVYTIVLNGQKMFIKADGKVTKYNTESNKIFKEINELMLTLVQGKITQSNKFKMRYFDNEKFYLVELTPLLKAMKGSLKTINMYFDKKDYSVSKLEMIEPSGDYTLINIFNKKINSNIANEKFTLK